MRTLFVFLFFSWVSAPSWSCLNSALTGKDLRNGASTTINPRESKKGTVLVFLSSQCPCSVSHEPTLEKLASEFKDFQFVAMNANQDEDETLSAQHFKEANLSFPVLRDSKAETANQLKALKTPHAYIIGPKGQCWYEGGVDDTADAARAKKHYLKNALLEIRQGKEPSENKVRTLGCVISR
jgi:thiol-disulfide isomerase/thioredoxin